MSKRAMFLRMVTASLLRRRSRMLIALLSIGIGATILCGLLTIYYDVPRQMGAQFRSYGANVILLADGAPSLTHSAVQEAMRAFPEEKIVGATPYRYVRMDMVSRQQSFTTAGTDFTQVQKTSPYFSVEGSYPENLREVLVGKEIAELIGVRLNSVMELTYKPAEGAGTQDQANAWVPGASLAGSAEGWGSGLVNVSAVLDGEGRIASVTVDAATQTPEIGGQCEEEAFTSQFIGQSLPIADVDAVSGATLTSHAVLSALNTSVRSDAASNQAKTSSFRVVGILTTGGEEEGYLFISEADMAAMTGDAETLDVVEMSVSASAEELDGFVDAVGQQEGVRARLVKRVTRSEAAVLTKLQALVFLVTVVVLLLTMICVSTTMMAVVTERRQEIGLRKALGASDGSIRAEFLGEGMFLGLLGGVLGGLFGFGFAQLVSVNVFGSSITFQPLLLPIAVILSMAVSALSCLWPIKRAVQIDPAIVLKGE